MAFTQLVYGFIFDRNAVFAYQKEWIEWSFTLQSLFQEHLLVYKKYILFLIKILYLGIVYFWNICYCFRFDKAETGNIFSVIFCLVYKSDCKESQNFALKNYWDVLFFKSPV